MHLAMLRYSVLRLAIFVASLAVLYLVGVRQSLLMLVLAAILSVALSYVLLRGPREEVARALSERTEARLRRTHPGVDEQFEDAADDRLRAAHEGSERETDRQQ